MLSAWHWQDDPGKARTALVTVQKLELGPTEPIASLSPAYFTAQVPRKEISLLSLSPVPICSRESLAWP